MSTELDETAPAGRESGPLPQRISKYELGERLGAGGNGVVMLARDVTLDRKVAIKLLRGDASEAASQRLQREAQAAAKLAHENVIVVHEVGTHDGSIFVAMEYVEGGTLRDVARTQGWRDVLDAYRRAGKGLAAAHAAGLVHRDFKPDNVLVGRDGRIRVSDFGLVSVSGTHAVSVGSLDGTALNSTLTRTGTVMGTPRYMAPEQHDGTEVDARADQFAFCVALYEALYHRPPFEGATYETIAEHVCAGDVVPPPADSPVPREVRDAVLRGLSPKREDRWPSMDELLAALTPPAPRARRWWLALVPTVLLVAAVTVFFINRQRRIAEEQLANERAEKLYRNAHVNDELRYCAKAVAGYRDVLALAPRFHERARIEDRLRELGDCDSTGSAEPLFKQGEDAYNRGDFPAAVDAFKRGFMEQPYWSEHSAAYLYDEGQAYRQMNQCEEASTAFSYYLELSPHLSAAMHAQITEMIKQLNDCAAQQDGASGSATR